MDKLDGERINDALGLLAQILELERAPGYSLVVCGGAALRLLNLHTRTTKDVDVIAFRNPETGGLTSPAPFPESLAAAARLVAREMTLPPDWLNNGPSSDEGGLFQLGLPKGIEDRLTVRRYGAKLVVSFVSRLDQIHFKLYAAIDQPGSYHTADLLHLKPSAEEIEMAMDWAMTHDVSEGFRQMASRLIHQLGFEDVAARVRRKPCS